MNDRFDMLLHLDPRCHQFTAAADTPSLKIHTRAEHQKTVITAWMGFFHYQNVIDANIHHFNLALIPLYRKKSDLQGN